MDNGHGYLNLREVKAFGSSTATVTTTTTVAISGNMFTAEDGTETHQMSFDDDSHDHHYRQYHYHPDHHCNFLFPMLNSCQL